MSSLIRIVFSGNLHFSLIKLSYLSKSLAFLPNPLFIPSTSLYAFSTFSSNRSIYFFFYIYAYVYLISSLYDFFSISNSLLFDHCDYWIVIGIYTLEISVVFGTTLFFLYPDRLLLCFQFRLGLLHVLSIRSEGLLVLSWRPINFPHSQILPIFWSQLFHFEILID